MKKLILLFAMISSLCFLSKINYAQAPAWLWAKSAGGTSYDDATSVAVDASGNTYVAGYFDSPTITFGSTTLTNADNTGNTYDLFLAKYNANGNVLWAKSAGGTSWDNANSVAVDASGNTYVSGSFMSNTITFGSTTLTNADGYDIFLAKYDANGNVLWAKGAGGTNLDWATSVAADASGNTYVAGMFNSPTLVFGSTILTNADSTSNNTDLFLAKYDVSGNVLWAKSAGGTDVDKATSVAVDASGNTYVAGWFSSPTITFGSTTLTNAGSWDMFLAKYDANGNVLWAKSAGGTGWEDWANSVAVDASGNTYVVGSFSSHTLSFGSNTLTNADSTGTTSDLFLAKYAPNGNVLWAKSAGGTGDDVAYSVAVDASGNIYLTGLFNSPTLVFGSTILTNADSTSNNTDLFLAKYDVSGNVLWAKSAGGTDDDYARSIAVDALGNIYVAGSFASPTLTFGSTTLTNADNTGNTDDIFLAKSGSGTGINELSNSLNISVFPNPSADNITINIPQKSEIEILNIEGQIIKSISAAENQITIDISGFASGMYFLEVKTNEGIVRKKFIKQ